MSLEEGRELFKKHIADIIIRQSYKEWKLIDENDLSRGIYYSLPKIATKNPCPPLMQAREKSLDSWVSR